MKPFKTLEEQIKILKSRGLKVNDKEKTKRYLLDYSYYEVINVYSKFFQTTDNEYVQDATFEEIRSVHIFDKELKSILFKSLVECEKHFKSTVAHRFSEYHRDIPFAYLKTTSYRDDNLLNLANTISILSKIISDKKRRDAKPNAIKHYFNNHKDVPLWVLINYLTFGQVLRMYCQFDNKLKNIIAKDISGYLKLNADITLVIEAKELENTLYNLVDMRNHVAHNNKLFDMKCSNHTKYINEIHSTYNIKKSSPRKDVFNNIIAMRLFLDKGEYAIVHNTILKRSKALNNKLESIPINTILKSLGFPNDWVLNAKKISQ